MPQQSATYDVDVLGVPRFIGVSYIDLAPISRISKFRSGFGHDYSDGVESCRSMKHYFQPRFELDWSTIAIYAPVTGEVTRVMAEQSVGTQIQITSTEQPAFTAILFHVAGHSVVEGSHVTAGQVLGHHISNQTSSDIAIQVATPGGSGRRFVSYFDAMTDGLFASYQARGIASRSDAIISRAARDASPLSCSGEAFVTQGTLENWVDLR